MDAISYSYADKQAKRIKKFIENPDSTSGIITVPKVIASGETITIPAGRVAILPNVQIDGVLNIENGGEVFIPSGATFGGVVEKITSTDNAIVRFDGVTGAVQDSSILIDDNGNIGSGAQSFNGFGGSGFKNYIINGNFDIWQRGASQTSDSYGSDDRWANTNVGSTKTHSQVACTNTERALFNASYFSRTVVTSVIGASNMVTKVQAIENVTKLAGKTVTISFWAKADSNKNIAIETEQYCGSGGASSGYSFTPLGTVSLTTSWQKKTVTFTIPSIIGKTLGTDGVHTSHTQIRFWFDAGSALNSRVANLGQQSGTFDIAQVQLEEGSVATPFENRPDGLELMLCQRYFEVVDGNIGGYGISGQKIFSTKPFIVTKRTAPTMLFTSLLSNNINEVSMVLSANTNQCGIYGDVVSTGPANFVYAATASAEL